MSRLCGEWDIPLKRKRDKEKDEYILLKSRLVLRTFGMLALSTVIIAALYSFFLQGRLANLIVKLMETFFYYDYYDALYAYSMNVRQYMPVFFVVAVLIIFVVILRIYLNTFSKYFDEINRGVDVLLRDDDSEANLSQELIAVEKKINSVKATLIRQREDIRSTEQRKNDLIMYIAHDLKTPLASVIGYLNLLHDEGQISEELRQKYLSISLNKAERLEDLINEFFEIARFNLSDVALQYSRINLTRLLEQLVYEFKPMLEEKNLKCSLNASEDMMLRCDADKIQRVFDNLLRNAVIYSFRDTEISIEANCQDGKYMIKFANRGDTISKEKLERIFEQFYRLDAARSTDSGGAGLGLAIAKQIVELHGGTIAAESENEQIVFVVVLPESV